MTSEAFDEAELVRRLAAGDRTAFERVFRRHNAAMIRLAMGLLRNRATAEEVTQDAWLAVLTGISGFEGRSSLAGWIYTILMNKARTRARREGRSVSFDDGGEENGLAAAFDGRGHWRNRVELWETLTPDRIVEGRSAMAHVREAIDALPPAQRAVLLLRGQLQLDAEEVCEILDIGDGNMRVLLHRARVNVRNRLDALMKGRGL